SANAQFISPTEWARPADKDVSAATNTTYQEWDGFRNGYSENVDPDVTANAPDVEDVNGFGVADLNQTTLGGFPTTTGNIYSFSSVNTFIIEVPGPDDALDVPGVGTNVLLQIKTLGSEFDQNSVTVNGEPSSTFVDFTIEELARDAADSPFGGAEVFTAISFFVPDVTDDFLLGFDAQFSSLSLDRAVLDTFTIVPEPGVLSVLAGGLLLVRRRRG
ncbi:MAG: hypothetical protein AAF656_02085, partial [Planctomycetota bacterium]